MYNAQSVERAGAGVSLGEFNAQALASACSRVVRQPSFGECAQSLRDALASLGGASRIVRAVERMV